MNLRENYAGRNVACSGCDRTITVPSVDEIAEGGSENERVDGDLPGPIVVTTSKRDAAPFEVQSLPHRRILLVLPGKPICFDLGVETKEPAPIKPILDRIVRLICQFWRNQSSEQIQKAELYWTINHFELGSKATRASTFGVSGHSAVGLIVKGTVNGSLIEDEFAATRSFAPRGGSSEQMVASCLDECVASGLSAMCRAAGVQESTFVGRWRQIQIFKWVATIIVFAGYLALTMQHMQPSGKNMIEFRDPESRRKLLLIGGILAALGAHLSIFTAALAIAPTQFLQSDPRGMKVMARVGMRNVSAMRLVAVLLAIAGVILIWCAIYIYRNPRFE